MRFPRFLSFSPILILTGICGLLLAGCGTGGTPSLPTPVLTFATIPTHAFGDAPFSVSATSASSGAVTYAVTSGPATVSSNLVTLTGVGTVVLSASQAATSSFSAATATITFAVTGEAVTLAFASIPTKAFGSAPFTVSATSVSAGAVTYAVTSGLATISGNTVTLTGLGAVVLSANQASNGNYAAAVTTTSFLVQAGVTVCPTTGILFCGLVQAAGSPVNGASVQLYSAGASGNGSSATALLTGALTTDPNGSFSVPNTLSCPSPGRAVFLVAKGGQPGPTATNNSALWLIAPLPPCGSLSSSSSITLNELSTVATAAALRQFYANGGNIGASSTNATGLADAILTEQSMVNMATGISPSSHLPANVTVSSAKLNTLANAFSACAASSTACTGLFAAATAGGTVPSNTLDAAFAIARNPGANVVALYTLSLGTIFEPALTDQPPDWMMYLTVSGGGLSAPTAVAVDGSGNLWSANYNEVLSEFSPNGTPVYANGITGSGLHESFGMAIDASNNVWVENDETPGSPRNGGTLSKFTNAGVALSGSIGYTAGLYFPTGIASSPNGDMWIANYGNSTFALYANSGTPASITCNSNGCGYGALEFPVAAAADSNNTGWIGNQSDNTVTRISIDGTSVMPIACCSGASGLAVDAHNNVWVANYFGDSISELSSTGSVISSGYTGGGIYHPQGIAVDGAGFVWVANYRGSSLTELAGATAPTPGAALSPSTGFGADASLVEPYGLAIDGSGNVWVSNYGQNTIVEFVGVASPVKTPLVGPAQAP